MRKIRRKSLLSAEALKLRTEQANANAKLASKTLDVQKEWNRARQNKPLKVAFDTLLQMAGNRERCMYCGDSQGTDIEHFWPKTPYPRKMFRWTNLLLGCTARGRDHKGAKFPLDARKQPLLIDPTKDDPWQFLDFDPRTGNFSARYDVSRNPTPKGEKTVEVLAFDRRESLAAGHQKTYKRISALIAEAAASSKANATALISSLKGVDEYGLLGWCFRGTGINEHPMSSLRKTHPTIWAACVKAFKNS